MQRFLGWLAPVALCAMFAAAALAQSDARTADDIIKAYDALERPKPPENANQDRKARSAYASAVLKYEREASSLASELLRVAPEHPRVAEILKKRWGSAFLLFTNKAEDLVAEADTAIKVFEGKDQALVTEAHYLKIRALSGLRGADPAATEEAINAFAEAAPKDPRVASLLYNLTYRETDQARKIAMEDRILKDFPDSPVVARIKGVRKQRESVGKPFELEFQDAISGNTVSIKGLKGKVVVIDFWATWCGPCIAEMPRLKELYAKYHDQGVEFIGVSLDRSVADGGLDALKKYVADNDVKWPQYYQGNYWRSEFSSSWGISSIPAMFVVDRDGNLHSVEARHQLETMIPALLKTADAPASGD